MNKLKCIVLVSGGLDSRLACKIMQEQCEVEAVYFKLPFGSGCCNNHCSLNFCQKEQIKLNIIDCTKPELFHDYLEMLRHPKHGRGSSMNPCIDCHIFMLRLAKQYADKNKIELIVTGEVLGERPMSQHSQALKIVEDKSGLKGRLLRPLSAKLLEETQAEKSGQVDRSKFFDIQGRSRKKQLELANHYKINYPTPGGGCLLCEPALKIKIKELIRKSKITAQDIKLLTLGRHINNVILGRNEQENLELEKMKGIKIIPSSPGPTALVLDKKDVELAKELIQKYSKHKIPDFTVKTSSTS